MRFLTHSEAETRALAARLAQRLRPGDIVLLYGDLGAGKSVFVRGAARALGVEGAMPSPTFTLMIPYEGKMRLTDVPHADGIIPYVGEVKLTHFDLYRLSDPDEFYAAGLDEYLGGKYISFVEWPEMAELEPGSAIRVTLSRGAEDDDARVIDIEGRPDVLDGLALPRG